MVTLHSVSFESNTPKGGIYRSAVRTLDYARKIGFDLRLLSWRKMHDVFNAYGFPCKEIDLDFDTAIARTIAGEAVCDEDIDTEVVHFFESIPFKTDKKSVVAFHDNLFLDDRVWSKEIVDAYREGMEYADVFMPISKATEEALKKDASFWGKKLKRVEQLYPCFIREDVLAGTRNSIRLVHHDSAIVVGTTALKNLPNTIEAFLKQGEVQYLYVVGYIQSPWLNALIAEHFDNARIIFTGFIEEADLLTLFDKTRMTVFFSEGEGFGYPAVETIARNKNVALSDIPVFHEVIDEAGYYAPFDDIESMSAKIREAAIATTVPEEKVEAIFSNYTAEKTLQPIFDIYGSV